MKERLQKILARAGHGSRRSAEAVITSGRVQVNGAVVTTLGTQADVESDRIEVDGTLISVAVDHVYLAMYKPAGFITTASDPHGRKTIMALLPPDLPPHVVSIGRLDRDTEGLLLLTTDGEFAHRMAHPRYEVEKEYLALVAGIPSAAALAELRAGVVIEDKRTSPAQADASPPPYGHIARDGHAWLRIIIHEGRKRQVRLMCAAIGHPVRALVRTRIGDVLLGRLAVGKTRPLSPNELTSLQRATNLDV